MSEVKELTSKPKGTNQHVDEWLAVPICPRNNAPGSNLAYAKFVIDYLRLPAHKQSAYRPFMSTNILFCTYNEERYRVNTASRMGDIGITKNHTKEYGYELRVYPNQCGMWSDKP